MKKLFALLALFFILGKANGQVVCYTDRFSATMLIYITDDKQEATIRVYKTDKKYEAEKDYFWYEQCFPRPKVLIGITRDKREADEIVYFTYDKYEVGRYRRR